MSEEEITEVKDLVAFSIGVATEKIALYNMNFYDPDSPNEPTLPVNTAAEESYDLGKILIYGGILVAILAIIVFIISIILKRKERIIQRLLFQKTMLQNSLGKISKMKLRYRKLRNK